MRYVVALTQSPPQRGRLGPRTWQDWYRGVVKSIKLREALEVDGQETRILVLSAFCELLESSEIALYTKALWELKTPRDRVHAVREGFDTLGQIDYLKGLRVRGDEVHLVTVWLQYLRVRWLCRGCGFTHYVAWGIPRPKNAIGHIVLTLLQPAIDLCGQRDRYIKWLEKRRRAGTL